MKIVKSVSECNCRPQPTRAQFLLFYNYSKQNLKCNTNATPNNRKKILSEKPEYSKMCYFVYLLNIRLVRWPQNRIWKKNYLMHVANLSTHYLLRSIVYKKNFGNNLKKKKSGTTKTEISLHRYYYQVKAVTYKTHHPMLLIGH